MKGFPFNEVMDHIDELAPQLTHEQKGKMMDYIYNSQYVRETGEWREMIDIVLDNADVYPLGEVA
jgi:hypothetical protein